MAAVHPTCIPYSKAAEKRNPPPREDCAYLLDPGEVHDEPPRRTHSIGDLIQRKKQTYIRTDCGHRRKWNLNREKEHGKNPMLLALKLVTVRGQADASVSPRSSAPR